MLISDKFVFVHMPKTGGTFVDLTLRRMLGPREFSRKVHSMRSYWGVRLPGFRYRYLKKSNHLSCENIPDWAKHLPIIGCIRSPYDWFVSNYRYGVWQHSRAWLKFWDPDCKDQINSKYPEWPKISFEQFIHACSQYTRRVIGGRKGFGSPERVGLMTLEFLRCFSRNRKAILTPGEDGLVERVRESLYPVNFIHMENLNQELVESLRVLGYPQELVEPIRHHPKIFPGPRTRPDGDLWSQYYSEKSKREVRHREWVLFEIFPEFDV